MATLVEDFFRCSAQKDWHVVELIAKLHHDFVLIHPFGDGNGRTARLLVNYILMRAGYPSLIVPTEEKDRYLAALRKADAGDLEALTEFLGKCVLTALERGVRAAKGESIEEADDLVKEIEVFKGRQKAGAKEVVAKSIGSIRAVSDHTLNFLFDEFVTEHNRLAELFLRTSVKVLGPKIQHESWQKTVEQHLDGGNVKSAKILGLEIEMKGFQGDAPKPFNVTTQVRANFQEFDYSIQFRNQLLYTKRYSEPLTTDERKAVIKKGLATIFAEVKKQSNKTS